MTSWTLVTRSLRYYWRTHLGVVLGAAVAIAVLVGALVIGDSVRYSLRRLARVRLGRVDLALVSANRYFPTGSASGRRALADRLAEAIGTTVAPVLSLRGSAATTDGSARINNVQVLGVDERFWALGAERVLLSNDSEDEVVLNKRAAGRLGVREGESLVLRVQKPSLVPHDAPLSAEGGPPTGLRVMVRAVAGENELGRFDLRANQVAPFTVFVPLGWLQKQVGLAGRANMLLVGRPPRGGLTAEVGRSLLKENWTLADASLEVRRLDAPGVLELRSDRVFLDPPVAGAAAEAAPGAVGVLTYLANELRVGQRRTPYSMVAAVGSLADAAARGATGDDRAEAPAALPPFMSDMADDETVINTWLAEDLQAKTGDVLEMSYYVPGPTGGLEVRASRFRIRRVVPIEGPAADPTLMPDFPGISDIKNCRDWQVGIPIDLKKIRDKDEQYWDDHRGTPKAFVTLGAGQRMWGNRFGNLTAVRYPLGDGAAGRVAEAIRRSVDPAAVGLFFEPVRAQALTAAGAQVTDFGQLFLGLSMFLLVAALLLVGLLFVFGVQQRTAETGILLAMGFRPRFVRRLLLVEGGILALVGASVGLGVGLVYTRAMLYLLGTVWRGAIDESALHFHAEPATLVLGGLAGLAVALGTIWLAARRHGRRPARELLAGETEVELGPAAPARRKPRLALWVAAGAAVAAIGLVAVTGPGRGEAAAGAFFGAGALLLVAGLALSRALLASGARWAGPARMTLGGLGVRNAARRCGRSLATVGLLACGTFLVVAVGANRHDPLSGVERRESGTGGFALFAESAVPVVRDLNDAEVREDYGLGREEFKDVALVPFRIREGDDASCLNLNRPQRPRLAGVRPEMLASRRAFTFAETAEDCPTENPWLLLERASDDGAVAAIADQATIVWSLGKKVGDTLPYTDERGRTFRIRLVGALANSILQGSLFISEDAFVSRFPSQSGYRMFLVDAPDEAVSGVSNSLSGGLQDFGLSVMSTGERLAAFYALENTYLSIFQVLGGLGLLLGSVGLGVVVLRNVLERRAELALLRAVGFTRRAVQWFVLCEHWCLLVLGLAWGVVSALIAVTPAMRSPGVEVPYASLGLTLAAIVGSGMLWTWLAALAAMGGPLLAALRHE